MFVMIFYFVKSIHDNGNEQWQHDIDKENDKEIEVYPREGEIRKNNSIGVVLDPILAFSFEYKITGKKRTHEIKLNQFHEIWFWLFSLEIKILLSENRKYPTKKIIPWNWFISSVHGFFGLDTTFLRHKITTYLENPQIMPRSVETMLKVANISSPLMSENKHSEVELNE